MSTLVQNISKVKEAHRKIGDALNSVMTPPPVLSSTRLSEYADIIKTIKPGNSPGWARPANWPRIDLIPMRNRTDDVMYFILEKPLSTQKSFTLSMKVSNNNKWVMEQISVSDDGLSVSSIAGTIQTCASGGIMKFSFPEDDSPGTIYAVRVRPETEGDNLLYPTFASDTSSTMSLRSQTQRSGICLEAICHNSTTYALDFSDGIYVVTGLRHLAYWNCPFGVHAYGWLSNTSLQYVELRGNTMMKDINNAHCAFSSSSTCIYDVDSTVKFIHSSRLGNMGGHLFVADSSGNVDWIDQIYDVSGNALDWTCISSIAKNFASSVFLKRVTLPAGYGVSAIVMNEVFSTCYSLQTLPVLPDGFGQCATNIRSMCTQSYNLISAAFPDGFGRAATDASGMFYYCMALQNVIFPDGFGNELTSVREMFSNCHSLHEVKFHEGFGSKIANAYAMFITCSRLSAIHFPSHGFGRSISELTGSAAMFDGCTSLSIITGGLELSTSVSFSYSPLTHDSIMNVINSIQNIDVARTLRLGSANLNKISDEEKKTATDKGWTLL